MLSSSYERQKKEMESKIGAKEIGIQASKIFEQGRRKRVIWIQKEQTSQALKFQMNRDIEIKVNKIIITIKSSRKNEFKLHYYFSPSLASCFGNLV